MKTAVEIYEAFLIELDKFASPDAEVIDFLHSWHTAVYAFIENELRMFELTNTVTDRLRMLSVPYHAEINQPSCDRPVKHLDLPGDYYRLFGVSALFEYARDERFIKRKGKTFRKPVRKYTADIENFAMENRYYKPNKERPFYRIEGNRLFLVYDTEDKPADEIFARNISLRYIRQPQKLELSDDFQSFNESEFPVDVNMLILRLAVANRLGTTGDPRIQMKSLI